MEKLILNQVSKRFSQDGPPAVDGVSLELRKGGFLALLGPSGCGKTTVLRMVAGFEQPSGGEILLGERLLADATGMVPPERRGMAMVFQSYALWPHMSVAENAGYPLRLRKITGSAFDERVRRALQAVRLEKYADRRPADLSGGQRQRVALARCLVSEPAVVLLDEPLANLDRHLRHEMEETFREFHARSGAAIIYVTHDQGEAMALASDVAVMAEGRLLQMAAPERLYACPEGRLVGSLVGRGAILSLALGSGAPRALDWSMLGPALRLAHAGGAADVLVRPEHVVPDPDGISCRVVSSIYEGERHLLRLALPGGGTLMAYSPRAARPGEEIAVALVHGWRL